MNNLTNKKLLASKVLGVGKKRICFDVDRLNEIKEAITKQDIKDLFSEGFITIRPIGGRKAVHKRNRRRGLGKIHMKVRTRKQDYVKITRKLRKHLKGLKNIGEISNEDFWKIRKKVRMRYFKSKANLVEYLQNEKKIIREKTSEKEGNKSQPVKKERAKKIKEIKEKK